MFVAPIDIMKAQALRDVGAGDRTDQLAGVRRHIATLAPGGNDRGLLEPAAVDSQSGYRYYLADQLPRINRILALKDLGLSLEEIGEVLDEQLTAAELRGMLRLKQAEIGRRVAEEQHRLDRVAARLRLIEKEGTMPTQEIVLKTVDTVLGLGTRDTVGGTNGISEFIGDVFAGVMGAAANVGLGAMSALGMWIDIEPGDWRWTMLVGALPVVLALLVFALVPESPRWLADRATRRGGGAGGAGGPHRSPVTEVFRPPLLRITLSGRPSAEKST